MHCYTITSLYSCQEYITYDPTGKPIPVDSDFHIKVPNDVISEYRNNPIWNSIRLIDQEGKIFNPSFFPYYEETY